MMTPEVWVTGNDIMTVAKLYNLSYDDAKQKIVDMMKEIGREVVFV